MPTQLSFRRALLPVFLVCESFSSGGRFIRVKGNRIKRFGAGKGTDGVVAQVDGGLTDFEYTSASDEA